MNVRGLRTNGAHLCAFLRQLPVKPAVLCLTETNLDASVEHFEIEDYALVSRRDRGSYGGGVATYARRNVSSLVVELGQSQTAERVWCTLHTEQGPFLIGLWYRPPGHETETCSTLAEELDLHRETALGTIVMGDMNVHNRRWLRYSAGQSAEGERLYQICASRGLRQIVTEPTRGENLLDLALTDCGDLTETAVHYAITDHRAVEVTLQLKLPRVEEVVREAWSYKTADWDRLREELRSEPWDFSHGVDEAAEMLTDAVMEASYRCISIRQLREQKGSHPWLNDTVMNLVQQRRRAAGTDNEALAVTACSEGIVAEFLGYTRRTREELAAMANCSKAWWKRARELMFRQNSNSAIPALRVNGVWYREAEEKAQVLADTFQSKFVMPAAEVNGYSRLRPLVLPLPRQELSIESVSEESVQRALALLDPQSGTGPDLLPSRILQQCAGVLGKPVRDLVLLILATGRWPEAWTQHWVVPIFKKKEKWAPGNYRGVHLTSQLSKAVERIIKRLIQPYMVSRRQFGDNQFAYIEKRGARDLLAYMVLIWILGLSNGSKYVLYCSDVSGAFDRVELERMVEKLRATGIDERLANVLESWLRQRSAKVLVNGKESSEFALQNMVYQGTVLGPTLWNIFFADAAGPIRDCGFVEKVYADDLSAYRAYDQSVPNETLMGDARVCQRALHQWGRANKVTFDAGKEGLHVISRSNPEGGNFKHLGVEFDPRLLMEDEITALASKCQWKISTILRARRFYSVDRLVGLYKAQVLSYIEYRTPAIFHAASTHLEQLERVQRRFLREVGMCEKRALVDFRLAPLSVRRDIAMLGLIHRTVLGEGPEHFKELFERSQTATHSRNTRSRAQTHRFQLEAYGEQGALLGRSALGMIRVYNALPAAVVENARSVKQLQSWLQQLVVDRALSDCENWKETLTCRRNMYEHPLRLLSGWSPQIQ